MATTNDNGTRRKKELDKFKRRMIRAVARLMLHEKVPEDEMWAKLKTETGYNCELLWGHMRSVALKKLKRMLAAEDRVDDIASMARMTVTDWLLFDLVLVHEKTDFIATDVHRIKKGELKPLTDLFSLVQKYEIEGLSGDALAQAWTEATLYYNSQGHHVSPMLLQKRWYQLKETTRNRFYQFWFSYRGNAKLFSKASSEYLPSMLQMAIARRFKEVVTCPFMEWEEMIQKQFIILSEEFDTRLRPPKKTIDENAPDLVLVEPIIETIDLEDSDTETSGNKHNDRENATPALKTVVKTEPIDIEDEDLSAAQNLLNAFPVHDDDDTYESELGHTEDLDIEDKDLVLLDNALENDEYVISDTDNDISNTLNNEISPADDDDNNISLIEINKRDVISTAGIDNVPCDNEDEDTISCGEKNHVSDDTTTKTIETLPQITSVFGNVDISRDNLSNINDLASEITTAVSNSSSDDAVDLVTLNDDVDVKPEIPIIEYTLEQQKGMFTVNKNVAETPIAVKVEATLSVDDINDKTCKIPLEKVTETPVSVASELNSAQVKSEECDPSFGELPSYLNLVHDGVELVDDGIAYVDEEMDYNNKIDEIKTEDDEKESESEAEAEEESTEDTAKIDLKLLLYPVVYTTRLDQMGVLNEPYETVDDKHLLDTILAKSKPISKKTVNFDDIKKENDNTQTNDNMSDEDEAYENIINNENRVKLSSYLLQKPRTRNYNPIVLCKNPDFNTRLKRLNVGFFSSQRNINLLKACKPLTIDLSKAFESKLVNGTIYLKSGEEGAAPASVVRQQQASVLPTAMPLQSLIDNKNVTPIFTAPSDADSSETYEDVFIAERSKVINLPDISQVRRLNQRLLTAEVTPIQVRSNVVTPPSIAVADCLQTNDIKSPHNTTIEDPTTNVVEKNNVELNSDINKIASTESDVIIEDLTLKEVNAPRQQNQSVTPTPNTTSNSNANIHGNRKTRPWNVFNDSRKKIPKTPCPPWKSRDMRPSVSWLSKNKCVNPPVDDALLTIDTLNKMLYLLTQEKDERDAIMQKKAKEVTRKCNKALDRKKGRPRKPQSDHASQITQQEQPQPDHSTQVTQQEQPQPDHATQITQQELSNDDVQVISEENEKRQTEVKQPKDKQTCKPKIRVVSNRKKYCCWAQGKIQATNKGRYARRHDCPSTCKCCCLNELQIFIKDRRMNRSLDPASQSIESVVQQTYSVGNNINPKNDLTASKQNNIKMTSQNRPFRISLYDSSSSDGSDKETDSIDVPSAPTADSNDNVIRVDVLPVGAEVSVSSTVNIPKINVTISTSSVNAGPSLVHGPLPVPTPRVVNPFPEPPFQKFRYLSSKRYPKPTLFSKTETSSSSCKCIVPISVDSPHRKIIIDGSSTCPLHKSIIPKVGSNDKQIFLTSRQILQKPSQSPIFLGKNKILLTNVKFPPEFKSAVNLAPQAPRVKIIPTLPLPTGVQLILQPNGDLSYNVDPNVPVNSSSLEGLPQILEAVKQQLNCMELDSANQATKNVSTQNSEVVTLSDDETSEANTCTKKSQPVITNTSDIYVPNDTSNTVDVSKIPKELNANIIQSSQDANSEEVLSTAEHNDGHSNAIEQENKNKINANVPIEVKDVRDEQPMATESNPQINQTITVDNDSQSNSENKDSVVSETIDPSINEVAEENKDSNKSKNILSDLMEMSGISAEDVTPAFAGTTQPEAVHAPPASDQAPLPQSIHVPQCGNSPNIAASLSEFSPIMSFAELKYACMQNGLFFKLDFETGSIIPINVCIKKHGENKTVNTRVPASVTIDLTDDNVPDNKLKPQQSPTSTSPRSLLIANQKSYSKHKFGKAKPVKLFKSVHPNILRDTNESDNPKANVYVVKNLESFKNIPKFRLKRKQDLNQIDARIDMVDSDCPMEEEYLESSGSDGESRKRKVQSDDSSDEEPLSKVAKRMRDVSKNNETAEKSSPAIEKTGADDEEIENFSVIYDEQSEEDDEDPGDDCILGV